MFPSAAAPRGGRGGRVRLGIGHRRMRLWLFAVRFGRHRDDRGAAVVCRPRRWRILCGAIGKPLQGQESRRHSATGWPPGVSRQLVASGRAQISHTDAAGIVQAQQQGIPVVAIAALYQDNPVGVLSHKDQNITSFDGMKGRTLVSQAGALYPVWLDKERGIPLKTMQYQGSIANFLKIRRCCSKDGRPMRCARRRRRVYR